MNRRLPLTLLLAVLGSLAAPGLVAEAQQVTTEPPTVVVHRPAARVVVHHPAPRVLVVQQRPAPVVVHHPQPVHVMTVQQHPQRPPRPPERPRRIGLFAAGGGVIADHVSMGGFSAGLKLRPIRALGIRIGAGAFGGRDYNGFARTEVPISADLLVYLNPDRGFQIFFLGGAHFSNSFIDPDIAGTAPFGGVRYPGSDLRYTHLGGQLGIGAEIRIGSVAGITFDARALLRQQVRDGVTEFTEVRDDGSLLTSNTSAGWLLNFGGVVYF